MYVDVIVDISVSSLDRVFQYHVPAEMESMVSMGCQVTIPFGRGNRQMAGFVTGITDIASYDPGKIKDLIGVAEGSPSVTSQLISLAEWIRVHNGSTMTQALKTVMPVRKKVRENQHITWVLSDRAGAEHELIRCSQDRRMKARARFLRAIIESGSLGQETVTGVLQITLQTLKPLERDGIIRSEASVVYRNPVHKRLEKWQACSLNAMQRQVVEDMWSDYQVCRKQWQKPKAVHLLHGITGSGKTEVYMALMDHVIAEGKQVIVLIPEISLTLQTVSRFYEHFGDRIAVMNSRMSAGEKYDQYMRCLRGEASVMIGPRSALFTPFDQLGLIIIDEEHENAYKSETTPRYHARETAIARAEMAGAMVVLGSATPSVASYRKALSGQYRLHKLTERAREGSTLPSVQVVDLREEFRLKNKGILSGSLKQAMEEALERKEQIMLFINRRGYAGFVSCRSCGHVVKCPHCEVSMTEHYNGILKCHYCGYTQKMLKKCPECGSPYIASFGIGTQKVETFIKHEFPQARVLRMDKDTTSGKEDMTKLLQTFSEGGADILIGTQMIVKGHDFENVTLVGVLAADLSMFSGDYLSSERTFQLLTQAAGRAGRGSRQGRVIIQTYQPEHYCITSAAAQDYDAFYEQEIMFRKALHYPPEQQMMMVLVEGPDDQNAGQAAEKLKGMIQSADFETLEILGPTRAGISRIKDMYRYVMYIKSAEESELIRVKDFLEGYISWSGMNRHLFINFDLDPAVLA